MTSLYVFEYIYSCPIVFIKFYAYYMGIVGIMEGITMKKVYNVKLNKYFDKDMGCIVMELNVGKNLTDLLSKYAIREETLRTDWSKVSLNELNDGFGENYNRCLIKTVLKSSVRWVPLLDLLFTDEILNNQKIKVPLNNVRAFTNVTESIDSIKAMIKVAEEVDHDRDINITLNISDE
jgi:hypothetical protein